MFLENLKEVSSVYDVVFGSDWKWKRIGEFLIIDFLGNFIVLNGEKLDELVLKSLNYMVELWFYWNRYGILKFNNILVLVRESFLV